jgi:hypothetical protein
MSSNSDQIQAGAAAQALSDRHKEAVKSFVLKARRVLETDFAAQLGRLGLQADGKHTPESQMALPVEKLGKRHRLEALLSRDSIAEGGASQGYQNVVRELTYTLLNRLVGLKAMEARHLLFLLPPGGQAEDTPEKTEVITPVPGQQRSRFLRDFRAAGGSRYKHADDADEALLHDGLASAFRQITGEIKVLFDPDHEYACIWPTYGALEAVLRMINDDLPEAAYQAQDFLGWVYQFFNREEKKRVREETKGTPRTSYELAVINQFYTPSWVVKALVDNTLGRLWLQMHPDSALRPTQPPPLPGQRLSDKPVADYLVPRTGERIRYQHLTDNGQVETFKQSRDIRLLDPACGTMHFGQYAFGLFHQMYLDELEHAGQPGWPQEPSVKDPREIPAAIIRNNLFGVDIDPRAIQIASLSLLLTAKEAAVKYGFSPLDVKVTQANLVVANGVNLGEARLRKLVTTVGKKLGSETLQERLFTVIWENLQYIGELGSLVQVREGVADVLDDWVRDRAKEKGITRFAWRRQGTPVLPFMAEMDRKKAGELDLQRRLLEDEARQLEVELLEAIERAAGEATNDHTDRLFAEDTARGLKLLRVLSQTYDVVVMNPPYGSFVPKVKDFVRAAYPLTYNDIYAAFIDRATQLTEREGYVGALVSSSFTTLTSFEKLRTEILLKRNPLLVMLDLGVGILDEAMVEAAAVVVQGGVQ